MDERMESELADAAVAPADGEQLEIGNNKNEEKLSGANGDHLRISASPTPWE